MFAVAPLAPRVVLRVAPVSTVALVATIAGLGAWSLCLGGNGGTQAAANAAEPFATWGYRAGDAGVQALSALFVHADAVHLITNLLVLAIASACLEQVWGSSPTLLLFLGAGAAAIAFDARFAAADARVVGASAGVSALLGACFVRFRACRLGFAYIYLEYLRPRTGRFQMSCAAVGLLWAVQQTVGVAWSAWSGDTSVAFASHVGGSAAGIAVALAGERMTRSRARG